MNFEAAKKLLDECERVEVRDHFFEDREIYWRLEVDGEPVDVADGYFSRQTGATVYIMDPKVDMDVVEFTGEQARELAKCGKIVRFARNDETGPDEYGGV